jgi:hypothetical protein
VPLTVARALNTATAELDAAGAGALHVAELELEQAGAASIAIFLTRSCLRWQVSR